MLTPEQVQKELEVRVEAYGRTAMFALIGGVVLTGVAAVVGGLTGRPITVVSFAGAPIMLAAAALTWRTYVAKLHCPGCSGPLWRQTAAMWSHEGAAKGQCPGCSLQLVYPLPALRGGVMTFMMASTAVVFVGLGVFAAWPR